MHNEIMFYRLWKIVIYLDAARLCVCARVRVCWHKIKNFTNFASSSTCGDDGQDNITRHCAILVWNLFSTIIKYFLLILRAQQERDTTLNSLKIENAIYFECRRVRTCGMWCTYRIHNLQIIGVSRLLKLTVKKKCKISGFHIKRFNLSKKQIETRATGIIKTQFVAWIHNDK